MTRDEWLDNNGCLHLSRAKRKQWGQLPVKMDVGLTRGEFEACKRELLLECKHWAAWKDFAHLSRSRDAADAVDFLAYAHYNSRRYTGYSRCHYTLLNDTHLCSESESQYWGVPVGVSINIKNFPWLSSFRGDDSPPRKWPTESKSITTCGIWHAMNKHGILAHSRYSHIATLVSGLSCHSKAVRRETCYQMWCLTRKQKVVIWDLYNSCWICLPHVYKNGMDWPFETTMGGLMGHSGLHRIHGVTQMIKGIPCAIPYDEKIFDQIFENEISPENYDIDLDEWRRNKKSGFVLTNTAILREMQQIAKQEWDILLDKAQRKNQLHKFENEDYVKQKRREIARKESIYVVDDELYQWLYAFTTDLFHCFDGYVCGQFKSSIIEPRCCWNWSPNEVMQSCKRMSCVEYLFFVIFKCI